MIFEVKEVTKDLELKGQRCNSEMGYQRRERREDRGEEESAGMCISNYELLLK